MNKEDPGQKASKPKSLRRPKGPMSSASSGQPTVRPDARAGRLNTPERPLHDYVAEVSERTEVRKGVPLPLGLHESEGGANFALFSVTPAAFGYRSAGGLGQQKLEFKANGGK